MAAPMNFRTAFNGFNREDVVHFIEYINAKHSAEINQLKAELDLLRNHQPADRSSELEALQTENERLSQELEHMNMELALLNSRLEAAYSKEIIVGEDPEKELLQAQLDQLQRQYDTLKAEKEDSSNAARELEAYRRAERTERVARERAEQVYHQVNGVLAEASVKVEEAHAQIGDLTEKVTAQLAQLQEAVTGSRRALTDASATLYAIRPTGDNS